MATKCAYQIDAPVCPLCLSAVLTARLKGERRQAVHGTQPGTSSTSNIYQKHVKLWTAKNAVCNWWPTLFSSFASISSPYRLHAVRWRTQQVFFFFPPLPSPPLPSPFLTCFCIHPWCLAAIGLLVTTVRLHGSGHSGGLVGFRLRLRLRRPRLLPRHPVGGWLLTHPPPLPRKRKRKQPFSLPFSSSSSLPAALSQEGEGWGGGGGGETGGGGWRRTHQDWEREREREREKCMTEGFLLGGSHEDVAVCEALDHWLLVVY